MKRHSFAVKDAWRHAAGLTLGFLVCTSASAFGIDTGSPDISVRWDNTLLYNLGVRATQRDSKLANYAIADEGTYSFNNGRIVTNRLDVLSELDFSYKSKMGVHVSGAGWYDDAYGSKSHSNPNPPLSGIPSYPGNEYSSYTKRYYAGPSGELMDAFVFDNFALGSIPVAVKAGRHTEYWGESLQLGGYLNSIAYAQMPVDLQRGFATPGADAKSLFRPLNNISAQAQLTSTLSVAAQYFLEWDSFRFPEGGTYLGPVDFLFNGPSRQFLSAGLGFATRGPADKPKNSGEFGLNARWSPKVLDGTVGFYYRRYADKIPQILLTKAAPGASVYSEIYADDIDLYGISLSKQVLGTSVGAEVSYRRNTPLSTQILGNAAATGLPPRGETSGARGDTFHALINVLGTINKTALFDTASWATELNWNTYSKVRSGAKYFNAVGYAPCAGKGKWDGCTTKDFVGLGFTFTPTWYQVIPDVDLQAPISFSDGILGDSALTFGGNQATGNYSGGIGADIHQAYHVDLKYIGYFGHTSDNGTAVTGQNGLGALLKDRGYVALTLKATF